MPSWLVKKLESDGVLNASEDGAWATRAAKTTFCPHCRHPIYRGLLEMPTPWLVDVDPVPLSPEGEVLALLKGIITYTLSWVGSRHEINRRYQWQIRNHPAATLKGVDIVAQHVCGQPAKWPTMSSQVPAKPTVASDSELPQEAPY